MKRQFTLSLKGRIKNFPLPKNQPLVPLFEAIANSLNAIEERSKQDIHFKNPFIELEIIRDDQTQFDQNIGDIQGFIIRDNGIGFNEPNFMSFLESDSVYKSAIGGKGVGRFSWLVAFKEAAIQSNYYEKGVYKKRSFVFSTDKDEIEDKTETSSVEDNLTEISLNYCLPSYKNHIPKKAQTIAMRIIHHYLITFISQNCPRMTLKDTEENFDLNAIFIEKIKAGNTVEINIDNKNFELLHVKAEETSINGNKLYLCAHNRLVDTKELEKYIIDLDREIFENNKFWYIGVLTGDYLNENVDMNRLSFNIPEGGFAEDLINTLSMDRILNKVMEEIQSYLSEYLLPIGETKIKRITDFVTNEAPEYRHLLKYKSEALQKIKPNLSSDKLEDELQKIKRSFEKEIKDDNHALIKGLSDKTLSLHEYQIRFKEQIEKISTSNNAVLAEYVTHRKVIIDLLEFSLKIRDNEKYNKEELLHNLIYPMRFDSNDLGYDKHNLWLIDERLAYFNYISSDIPLENRGSRPDILLLNNPVAISDIENEGNIFDTIVMFELKRPMRDDYDNKNNPIQQLYEYVMKIQSGKTLDKVGRPIKVNENTKFYLYIICDITPSLMPLIKLNDLKDTPDKLGKYRYHDELKAYIEILPYDKLVNDSKKRNRVLFSKLGL